MSFAFSLRFREIAEEEGHGSRVFEFGAQSRSISEIVEREVKKIQNQHPDVVLDGMVFYSISVTEV